MKRKIAIVGAGSAGLLTATHLCTWLDDSWEVCAVHDPGKDILGIGESTNGAFISVLERGTNFSLANPGDMAALDATLKFGSKFVGWRARPWINPLLSGNIAIHFNNRRFKDFVFERLRALWPGQFTMLEAGVHEIANYADRVRLDTDRGAFDFDYVVDCMGTPPAFEGYTLSDCTLVDRCRIHVVRDYAFEPFTDHIATRDGWMFGVPLDGRKTYGYLYNQAITDERAAEEEMMRLLGAPSLDAGGYKQSYALRCYHANQLISGRVCKNGNRALFFEPLIANSMFLYIYASRLIYDHVAGGQEAGKCNDLFVKAVQEMEDVISYYYQGGSTFDSEFWRTAAAQARARLDRRPQLAEYLQKLATLKRRGILNAAPGYALSPHTWEIVDAALGYHSFEAAPA
ncbi:MAG TPA: tryptophan 7-halogenase [Polyangia bacterium]|nr:tryptophan 7-halogenase [Polyangia bacterium]